MGFSKYDVAEMEMLVKSLGGECQCSQEHKELYGCTCGSLDCDYSHKKVRRLMELCQKLLDEKDKTVFFEARMDVGHGTMEGYTKGEVQWAMKVTKKYLEKLIGN